MFSKPIIFGSIPVTGYKSHLAVVFATKFFWGKKVHYYVLEKSIQYQRVNVKTFDNIWLFNKLWHTSKIIEFCQTSF